MISGEMFEETIHCPYCGEVIEVLIDSSIEQQEYIEDCQVCCRPIVFKVQIINDDVSLQVFSEND